MKAPQITLTLALTLALFGPPLRAHAGDPCVGDAKAEFIECRGQCTEDFQAAKDDCLNRDHECVEVCRADRDECRLATGIDAAVAACDATLRAAKEACRANNAAGSPELDQCIDQAQVVAFQCRDAARERARPALKTCRAQFRACALACPPPTPPSEAIDPVQCKRDAKAASRACRATCVEDFQFQKDACRNRDHACVEQCRAERDGCRAPVEDALAAAIEQCNTDRDAAIQQCGNIYPADSPELDQCIDNAQVAAFICRDGEREQARPGFASCRQAFQACAEACPPAS